MVSNNPLVSIVMPAYNGERFIGKAIQSVLNQSYENWELVIVDDCGTDHTIEIARSFQDSRIKILSNVKNEGIAYSRNKAIENSHGEYIAILDDDDMALPDRLKLQVAFLEDHPNISVVGGRSYWIDEEDRILRSTGAALTNPNYIAAQYLLTGCYINCTCTFRKELFTVHHIRYQDNMLGMEDVLFWIECSKVAKMSSVEEFVSLHRDHPNRESKNVLNDGGVMREQLWSEIHDYSLQRSGFELSDEEKFILHKYNPEKVAMIPRGSEIELGQFYAVLKRIKEQAYAMNLDNAEEVGITCRKRFSRALEYSYLWA